MYKVFDSIADLYQELEEDKNWTGAESSFLNRYPLRFVLFENFETFKEFVNKCSNHNVNVQGMDKWMNEGYDDQFITHSQLAKRFEEYVKNIPSNDFVIAPFSEITRFYDNEKEAEFDSLLKTIRLIQSPEEAQQNHQRIYVPIIGMQGKMNRFKTDHNIHIWEYRSTTENQNYRLILTYGTLYGIKGLEDKYSICHNLREWISLWKHGNNVKKQIICCSKAIFHNACYAQPDNAFNYTICNNAFEFLTHGLHFEFGDIVPTKEDNGCWEQLCSYIDIADFNFESFVNEKFNSFSIDNEKKFVQAWFEHKDNFMRWLLKLFFLYKKEQSSYLHRVLEQCQSQSTIELFSSLAVQIFDNEYNDIDILQRRDILCEAKKHEVQITEIAKNQIKDNLEAIAIDPERGYDDAMKYISPLTQSEQELMIKWLGDNKITRDSIRDLFPNLYNYTQPFCLQLQNINQWINSYFTAYCKAKINNAISDTIVSTIKEKNKNPSSFELWRDNFKTVKTLLLCRTDIDVFYWIDGLGVDWIPFIMQVIEKHKVDGIYLNEIHIASAELPTRTANNKIKLEDLSPNLEKIGDVDSYAHTQKNYPSYIIKEFSLVEDAISKVLAEYNGKKIAFISDHGISYLSGLASNLKIAGIKSDHAGRCAVCENGTICKDNNYIILEDGKTICSLTHNSLTSKTPIGQGAHGGVTPEEVLVPIFIVSNQKNASSYSATLLDNVILLSSPILRYQINGISNIDIPTIFYNDVSYSLHKTTDKNIYESEKINFVETATKATLIIGNYKQTDSLTIKTGVDEDNLFGDF